MNPSFACTGTYFNDFLGPDRSPKAREECATAQNVRFVVLRDSSGFPHPFWEVLPVGVKEHDELLGDYGDPFWEPWAEGSHDKACAAAPELSPLLRGILFGLRGWTSKLAISIDGEGDGDVPPAKKRKLR